MKKPLSTAIRMTALLLSAATLAALMISCAAEKAPSDETTVNNNETADAASYLDTALPTDTYGGESIGFIGGSGTRFMPEEAENSEPVHDAIFRRDGVIQEKYDVKFKYTATSWGGETNEKLEQSSAAGESLYDVVYGNFNTCGVYMVNNSLIMSLENIPYVDLTQKWWSTDCMNQLTIHDKTVFLTGMIAYDYCTDGTSIFFNKKLSENAGLGDHFTLVRDGKWTIDVMNENIKKVANDDNGDLNMDSNDTWGLVAKDIMGFFFYYGAGVRLIDYDEDGSPYFIASSNEVITKIDRLRDILSNRKYVSNIDDKEYSYNTADSFAQGKALYTMNTADAGASTYRPADFYDFGILPAPMWDEEQNEYFTWAETWSGGGIYFPITNHNEEMTGVIVEALAYQSSIQGGLYNAVLEKFIKGKGTYDQDSEEMVDLVLSTKLYDLGMIFGWGVAAVANDAATGVWNWSGGNGGNFSSMYATRVNGAKKAVRTTIRSWDSLE